MEYLKGKRVLYLGPHFFGYEYDIKKELISRGAIVDFYNERVFVSDMGKILVRLGIRFLINRAIKKYYERILKQAKNTPYDYLLVVSPETMPLEFVSELKRVNSKIKTVLYMWDSVVNKNNSTALLAVFDRALTFDPEDKELCKKVEFLPLFYTPDFSIENGLVQNGIYSVSFIGTVHSDRYEIVKEISKQFDVLSKKQYCFFYCPSKLLYFLKKIFTKELSGISISDVDFRPLSKRDVSNILSVSDVVIDIEHPSQKGLTMRSIEMLGSARKLITTNKEILNYDFYDPSNICVVDRVSPKVPKDFIATRYKPLNPGIVAKYSLSSWVNQVFDF